MINRKWLRIVVAVFIVILFLFGVALYRAMRIRDAQLQVSSWRNLSTLRMPLGQLNGDYARNLICSSPGEIVTIVSAEKIFGDYLRKLGQESLLVSSSYYKNRSPVNPGGKTVADKWDSSFYSWFMPAEKWEQIEGFIWNGCGFPMLWDKHPELNAEGNAIVLFITREGWYDRQRLNPEELNILLVKAKEWLEPETTSLKNLEDSIKNGSMDEQNFAIRMLGRKKAVEQIPLIVNYLTIDNGKFAWAAAWALGAIGDPQALPYLDAKMGKDRYDFEACRAIGMIGGDEAVAMLAAHLKRVSTAVSNSKKSESEQSRIAQRQETIATSLGNTKSKKAIPVLLPLISNENNNVRHSASDSLAKLGWSPDITEQTR